MLLICYDKHNKRIACGRYVEVFTVYFKKPGPRNTQATIDLALQTARERGIKHIVVASTSGRTAMLLAHCHDLRVVCVTHVYGFSENGKNEMEEQVRLELQQRGVHVLTTTHVLSGVERGISAQSGGMYPAEIMSNTLRMLGQGTKVCVEIAIMALDTGLIPHGDAVIAIGGTGAGADTAAIVTPAHAQHVFKTKLHEILCKPY